MIKNLADVKGDAALDLVADLIDPVTEIMSDPVVAAAYRGTEKEPGSKAKAIKVAIKTHKKAITTILALMDEEDPKTYEPSAMVIPVRLLQILNDPDMNSLFTLPDQSSEENTSGSASENSKDEG
jgi:hypothetical protein